MVIWARGLSVYTNQSESLKNYTIEGISVCFPHIVTLFEPRRVPTSLLCLEFDVRCAVVSASCASCMSTFHRPLHSKHQCLIGAALGLVEYQNQNPSRH